MTSPFAPPNYASAQPNYASAPPNYASAQRAYRVALQNFRGLLGRQRAAQAQAARQALGTDPTDVARYAITGRAQLNVPTLVPASEQLTALAQQLMTQLSALVHSTLAVAPARCRLVVGLSGGADSALVLVLAARMAAQYGYQVQAVHCIHGLDPDDAIWLEHNQALCAQLGVALTTPQLNIVYGGGVSPEDASRQERYRALLGELRAAEEQGLCAALLLGHQADDQIESFMLALKRGSGPQGLAGMNMLVRDERGTLVRPLLDLHKHEVEQVLTLLNVPYVYDLSNSYLKFERNFVRLKVLPQLKARFPGVAGAILRSQKLCRYEHDLAQRLVQEQLMQLRRDPWTLDFAPLDLSDQALTTILVRTFISEAIGSCEFNHVEQALTLMAAGHDRNGLVMLTPPWALSTFLHYLCIYQPLSEHDLTQLTGRHELKLGTALTFGPYRYELVPAAAPHQSNELRAQALGSCAFAADNVVLDFDYARGQALRLQGRAHARPLKKLMIAAEIAPWLRPALPLIYDLSGELLAVALLGAVADTAPRYELRISRSAEVGR